jgi:hypothetical protein
MSAIRRHLVGNELLGYAGAFRRSELVALDVEDLKLSKVRLNLGGTNDPARQAGSCTSPGRSNIARSMSGLFPHAAGGF